MVWALIKKEGRASPHFRTLDSSSRTWRPAERLVGVNFSNLEWGAIGNERRLTMVDFICILSSRIGPHPDILKWEMDFAEIIFALFIVVVAIVSLLSNLLVLLCFVHSTEIRRQVPGIFTMNLSFCNILITILNMPTTLVGIIRNQQPFGNCLCHTVSFLETFLTANTMLSMAALSIDRWIAVVFPLSYSSKMRYKDAVIMVCYSWLYSLTFSLIALLFSWVDYSHIYASCTLHLTEESDRIKFTVFTVVFHATSFVLSLLILCFTYLKVLKVARFHCKRIDIITMQTLFLLVDIHPRYLHPCLSVKGFVHDIYMMSILSCALN